MKQCKRTAPWNDAMELCRRTIGWNDAMERRFEIYDLQGRDGSQRNANKTTY